MKSVRWDAGFSEINPESVESCLAVGAAKINGLLKPVEVRALASLMERRNVLAMQRAGQKVTQAVLLAAVPALRPFFDVFSITASDRLRISELTSHGIADAKGAHIDADDSGEGISLILPATNELAAFWADENEFTMGDPTAFAAQYNAGDGMLIRQKITSIKTATTAAAVPCEYGQAWHLGYSRGPRHLVTIDYLNPDLRF